MLLASCSKTAVTPKSDFTVEKQSLDANPITYSTSDTIRIQGSVKQNMNGGGARVCLLSIYLSKAIPDTITAAVEWKALNSTFTDTIKIAGVREQYFNTRFAYYNDIIQVTILSAKVNNSKYILKY